MRHLTSCLIVCAGIYGMNDFRLAKLIVSLVRPGGYGYERNYIVPVSTLTLIARRQSYLNAWSGIKLGHPCPPSKRVARLLNSLDTDWIEISYPTSTAEIILFRKNAVDCG
jgi:hypothetical protein